MIILFFQNQVKNNYKDNFLSEKKYLENYLENIQNSIYTMASDINSSTIHNILDRQLNLMDIGEISALKNGLMISDNIKTYVQFHDRYKNYLDEVYFDDYLNKFYIYNNNFDKLSPYLEEPINKDLANKVMLKLSNNSVFATSDIFEFENNKYMYLATKNRELRAGNFTDNSLGFILYEIKLAMIDTELTIINKSDLLEIDFLPIDNNKMKDLNINSTFTDHYISSPISFLNSNLYAYNQYNNNYYNLLLLGFSSLFILFLVIYYYSKINYNDILFSKIPLLEKFSKKSSYETDVFTFINQILAKREFENDFLRGKKHENKLDLFLFLYNKYYDYIRLPEYISIHNLKDMNFVFYDKIDMSKSHVEMIENLEINSECIKDIRNSYFDNNISSIKEYIKSRTKDFKSSIDDLYIDIFSINDEQVLIFLKFKNKNELENFKNIIKNI
ncbi:MAG: hypothetical protein ACQESN_03050 [Thermotogota bacterium]